MNQSFWLAENCKNWYSLKSWKSLGTVLAKILGGLTRCDGNGLISNRMLNKKRIIVIIVWQLCRAHSWWQTLKHAVFQSVIASLLAQAVIQGVTVSQGIVYFSISSSGPMELSWDILWTPVTALTSPQRKLAPYGLHVCCGWGAASLAGHAAAEPLLTLIKVLILAWPKRIVTILWRAMLDCRRKWNK